MDEAFQSHEIQMTISLFLLIFPLLSYFIFRNINSHNPPLPPGPTPWPIIGNIHRAKALKPTLLSSNTHVTLSQLAKTYGPLMSFKLGTKHLIVGSSPEAAVEILKNKDKMLSGRTAPQAVPLTSSQISQRSFWADPWDEHWKNIRTLCRTEFFSSKGLDMQARLREEKIVQMVDYLRVGEGTVVNVEKLVFATVVNIFSNAFFSTDFISLDEGFSDGNKLRGLITGIIEAISAPNLSDFYPVFGKFDFQGLRKKHREISVRMHELWKQIVKERRERWKSGKSDFLDTLLEKSFIDEQINQLFKELFTAGIDTTTSTIYRTMLELLNEPESMKRLQQELDEEFHQDKLSQFHSLELPYLNACIKETLRLHPPAALLLSHRANETCQVMG